MGLTSVLVLICVFLACLYRNCFLSLTFLCSVSPSPTPSPSPSRSIPQPCTEVLFLDIFHNYSQTLTPVLLEMVQNLQGELAKGISQ